MGCGIYWHQIHQIDSALETMGRYGIPEDSEAFQSLWAERGSLMAQVGQKFPRETLQMRLIKALYSPQIRLWFDIECGWMVEVRAKPGAPPVYRSVNKDLAMRILKGEISPEEEEVLAKPDEYIGE